MSAQVVSKTDMNFKYADVMDAGDITALKELLALAGTSFDETKTFPFEWFITDTGAWGLSSGTVVDSEDDQSVYYALQTQDFSITLRFPLKYMASYHFTTAVQDPVTDQLVTDRFTLLSKCRVTSMTIWSKLVGELPLSIGNLTSLTGLQLTYADLSGSIPSSIGNLKNLTILNLLGNKFSGSIPPEIGNLLKLEWIILDDNNLSGSIPPEIGNLINLRRLELSGNRLSGSIPAEIGKLINLTHLYLSSNELSGAIPTEIGKLTNIVNLHLWSNKFSGNIPDSIGNLVNLTELELPDMELSGAIPATIGNLSSLTLLDLQNNKLSGAIPSTIGNIRSLLRINIQDNQISGEIPNQIGNLGELLYLDISNNRLTGVIPPEIGNLTSLVTLQLNGNQFSGSIPDSIGNLVKLTDITIQGNELSGPIPASIGNLTLLEDLWLNDNQLTGSIPATIGNLTNLTGLSLADNHLSGPIPASIGNLKKLEVLYLENNHLGFALTDIEQNGEIPSEMGDLINLYCLDMANNCLSGDVPNTFANIKGTDLSGSYVNLSGNYLNPSERAGWQNKPPIAFLVGRLTKAGIPMRVSDITVMASNGNGGFVSSQTESDGAFYLGVPSNGDWKIDVDDAYLVENFMVSSDLIRNISGNQSISGIDVPVFDAKSTISGTVMNAKNLPAPDQFVYADAIINGLSFQQSVSTDASGKYTIPVIDGTWRVETSCTNGEVETSNYCTYWAQRIVTVAGASVGNVNSSVVAHLTGKVTKNGLAVSGVGINALIDGSSLYATSGPDGGFDLAATKNGEWLIFIDSDYLQANNLVGPQITKTITKNQNIGNISIPLLQTTTTISGVLRDSNGTPISGVNVYAYATINGLSYRQDMATDSGGKFSLPVCKGAWSINVAKSGYSPQVVSANTTPVQINFKSKVAASEVFIGLVGDGQIGSGTSAENMAAFWSGNGYMTLTKKSDGSFSGNLRLEGKGYPMKGKFDVAGMATFNVKRSGNTNAVVALVADPAVPGKITGNVTTSGNPLEFILTAQLHDLSAGSYTVLLPSADGTLGHGFGALVVAKNGTAKLTGKLADGMAFTSSSLAVDGGSGTWLVPLHIPLYAGSKGMLVGEVIVSPSQPADSADVTGTLGWLRPLDTKAKVSADGFLKPLDPIGEAYQTPKGISFLTGNVESGSFTVTADPQARVLSARQDLTGTWPKTNVPTLTKPAKITFAPKTGLFKGNFQRTVNGKATNTPYEGVVFAHALTLPGETTAIQGGGFFSTGSAFGQVELTAP